jgi:exonuclease III
MYWTDIYRIFHLTVTEYTFYSTTHRTFSKTDHILEHKESLNKYKKTEIISWILSDHNGIKVEISNNRNDRKFLKA